MNMTSDDGNSVFVQKGEHIKFGSYQGEKIEWRVLDVIGEKALLLSEYGLDVKPYNDNLSSGITWESCTLRRWLNDEFYEKAFTVEERNKILLSTSEGFPEYNSRLPGGEYDYLERETEDYVFLLSYTEVYQYISNNTGDGSNDDRLCYPTDYVKSNFDIHTYQDACGWWLCAGNARDDECRTMIVSELGSIHVETEVDSNAYTIRPAMWVKW